MEVYLNIVSEELKFPWFFNGTARQLIESLLDRNPISRLGSLGLGSLDVLEHDFFDDLSFADLERKSIPAPYIPDISNQYDASKFGQYDDDDGPRGAMNSNDKEVEQLRVRGGRVRDTGLGL